MDGSALEDTLEEGRLALILLEKQLSERREYVHHSDQSLGSNSRHTSHSRRMLDTVSRDTRLHNRKGSPLGLTIEVRVTLPFREHSLLYIDLLQELDDRGLLNGGGLANRGGSIRQKNRRPLEMRNRLTRLQDRDSEV
jgi:hypothetical protein